MKFNLDKKFYPFYLGFYSFYGHYWCYFLFNFIVDSTALNLFKLSFDPSLLRVNFLLDEEFYPISFYWKVDTFDEVIVEYGVYELFRTL